MASKIRRDGTPASPNWGGGGRGQGRKPNPNRPRQVAETRVKPAETKLAPAEPKTDLFVGPAIDPRAWIAMLPQIEEISAKYALKKARTMDNNPFQLPQFPKSATPPADLGGGMAMDNALTSNLGFASNAWLAGDAINGLTGEGLLFLGYTYLSELAQRPEYRVMSETIADDATRKWIDFDVVGDEKKQKEDREKDPDGYDERMADPDERKKRVDAAGKSDRVKALKDDQLRLEVKDRFYEQCRNGGFFGRTHLFLDIRTNDSDDIDSEELKSSIGDSRDATSQTKVPIGSFKGMRTIEPVWTYPLMYNAINPLRKDWYNPQVWYVMGQQIHGTRLQTFIPHPVPDMLKPAYAFGGLSLTQMSKPYVDRWLTTVTSINQLIHSFSVMVLMTDLSTLMQPNNIGPLLARVAMFNMFRDNQGAFVINKNTEDFKNVSAQLSGLHELQAQAQEHMASINRIPLVKFTGIQPAGLNASSEGEIEVYDDTIGAYQARVMDPNLRRVVNFQQLSLWGAIDPEITTRWEPLRPMTQAEKGQKEKDDADRNQKYVDMGAISPEEVRRIIIDDPELPYTGLDPDDVPEPPAEEGLLGPGAGAAAGAFEKNATGQDPEPDAAGGGQKPPGGTDATIAADDEGWNESLHPRAPDGKFGSGGGGSSRSPQMGELERSGSKPKQMAQASKLYTPAKKTADQIVASFPGAVEAIEATRKKLAALVPTDAPVSQGGFRNPDGTYTAEREALHRKIAADFFPADRVAAALPKLGQKPVLTVLGGRGGSGKSWLTGPNGPVDEGTAILVDADAIKGKLPGYEGWNASAFHEESSHILGLVDQRAVALGVNTIHDATLKSEASSAMRMAQYEEAGFEVEGYYMYAAPETAATRALARYSKGGKFTGRFVPPEIILGNTNNEKNFDKMSGGFRKWAVYDNNAEGSAGPKLVSRSDD